MTTLLQLKAFMTVVDQGGFTAAGPRLGLSQPAVSRAIATLEKDLGLRLFVRRRDGLSLTEAGSVALTHAREALRQLTLMSTEVASLAGDVTGTLSLASLPTATATFIAPQLRTFAQRHPAVTIRLLEGSEEEVRDWLDQGAVEAGVVSLPVKGLEAAVLGDQHLVAVVPTDSRLASKDTVSYADLAKEPFVRGKGGARMCSCRLRGRLGSSSTWHSTRAKSRQLSRSCELDSGCPSCRAPVCPNCLVSLCGRWCLRPCVASASPSLPARPARTGVP